MGIILPFPSLFFHVTYSYLLLTNVLLEITNLKNKGINYGNINTSR